MKILFFALPIFSVLSFLPSASSAVETTLSCKYDINGSYSGGYLVDLRFDPDQSSDVVLIIEREKGPDGDGASEAPIGLMGVMTRTAKGNPVITFSGGTVALPLAADAFTIFNYKGKSSNLNCR